MKASLVPGPSVAERLFKLFHKNHYSFNQETKLLEIFLFLMENPQFSFENYRNNIHLLAKW